MAWVRKPGHAVPPETEPRRLTRDEIEDIIRSLPPVRGATKVAIQKAQENIATKLRRDLMEVEISSLSFGDYKEMIIREFRRCQIEPQTPVGLTASDNLGRPVTQTTLNTFHTSGSSRNVSGGLDAIRSMVNATPNLKNECATIFFRERGLSYIDAIRKKRDFVGLTIGDILSDPLYDIAPYSDLEKFWWHDAYIATTGKVLPESDYVMRLYLDVNKVFQHRATMERIVAAIEDSAPPRVFVVHSPLREGIIDLIPDRKSLEATIRSMADKKKMSKSIKSPDLIFLENVVRPALGSIVIQGIPGIKAIYPVPKSVWGAVISQKRVYRETDEEVKANPLNRRLWYLFLNQMYMRINGVGIPELDRLLNVAGFQVQDSLDDPVAPYILVLAPTDDVPGAYIDRELKKRKAADIASFAEQRKNRNITVPPLNDPLIVASQVYCVDTSGCNLREILSHDDVDPDHTHCNNIHHMNKALGILASRNIFVKEFTAIANNAGASVNPRYIDLLASFIYGQGQPYGLTFAGICRQPVGHIAMSSFQQSAKVLARAAQFGQTDRLLDTSSSIVHGKRPNLGTGGMDIEMLPSYKEKIRDMMRKGITYGQQEIEEAIKQTDQTVYGPGQALLEGDLDLPSILPSPTGDGGRAEIVPGKEINPASGAAPLLSGALLQVHREMATVPGQINLFKVTRLGRGLLSLKPIFSIPVVITTYNLPGRVQLDPVTFVESFVKPRTVEVPVGLIILPDDFNETYAAY